MNQTVLNNSNYHAYNNPMYMNNPYLNHNFLSQLRESFYVKSVMQTSYIRGFIHGLITGIVVITLWVLMIYNINSTPDL